MSAQQMTQPGQWSSFSEARAAMDTMSLEELEEAVQVSQPRLLPLTLPALGVGILLVLIAFGRLWLLPFGLALAMYGAITGGLNRTRVAQFREQCYRTYVHRRADEIRTEEDQEEAS